MVSSCVPLPPTTATTTARYSFKLLCLICRLLVSERGYSHRNSDWYVLIQPLGTESPFKMYLCPSLITHMLVMLNLGIFEHDESCELSVEAIGDELKEQEAKCLAATLQPGTNLVAAAYCLYSSSTFLTLTLGNGVFMFTLDEAIGEFVLSRPNVKIPESSTIYSFNEANCEMWDEPLRNVVEGWREGTGASGKRFSSRYMGSMVGDVHRTLLSGGVFGYPRDTRNPNGKLRLLYEAVPISFIMEQAGGLATTGTQRAMEIVPQAVHQRTPVMMGSKNDILEIIDAYLSAGSQTK